MKKYLIMGVLSLTACVYLAGCKDHEIDSSSVIDSRKQRFEEVFKQVYGSDIDPNQDWGFWNGQSESLSTTRTRTIIKQDMTNYPSAGAPAAITDAEREYVNNWFANNPGLSSQGLNISNFYIQHVIGNKGNKQGIWHRYDQNRINNGYASNEWDEEFSEYAMMDYLMVGAVADASKVEHVNDFNAMSGGPYDIVYIENGSALQFGYHGSWDSSDRFLFKLAQITVPGVGTGYYVGLSLYGTKYDNGTKEIGIQRYNYGDDWILKIVPGTGEVPTVTPQGGTTTVVTDDSKTEEFLNEYGRVFCEDLGISAADAENNRKDLDYNDAVFDVYNYYKNIYKKKITTVTTINGNDTTTKTTESWELAEGPIKSRTNIILQAAGGTIPLQIGGQEVHELFNVGVSTMVNTVRNETDAYGSYTNRDPVSFNTAVPYGSIDSIPIIVRYSDEVGEITAYEGTAPMKICVPIGTMWPAERQGVGDAYPNFRAYVSDHNVDPWSTSDADFLFTGVSAVYVPQYNVEGEELDLEQSMSLSSATDLHIPNNYFTIADGGAIVYVYGEARNGAEVKAYVEESEVQGSYAQTRAVVQSLAFTLDATQVEAAKLKGVTIKGKNYIVHKASVSVFEPALPDRQGTIIWEGEKEITATSGIEISSSNFAGAGEGTKIRVYGIGKKKGDDAWRVVLSKNTSDYANLMSDAIKDYNGHLGAFELEWTLDKSAAEEVAANGLFIRGQKFKVGYVTVEVKEAEVEIPARQGTVIWEGSKDTDWGVNAQIDASKFSGAGIGSVLRVYGVGNSDSWQVKLCTTTSWAEISGLGIQNYWTLGNVKGGVVMNWTLTEAAARELIANGVNVTGPDFTLKYVTIDNTNATPVSNNSDEGSEPNINGTTTWSATSFNNQELVSAETLKNAGLQNDKEATLLITGVRSNGTTWWEAKPMYGWTEIITARHDNQYKDYFHWGNDDNGYIAIPFSASVVNNLLTEGFRLQYYQFTISKIEIKQ